MLIVPPCALHLPHAAQKVIALTAQSWGLRHKPRHFFPRFTLNLQGFAI